MRDGTRPSLERQLLSNQVWETVAFIAKAAFMVGLTPWMIRTWSVQGYGEFALASSTFVLLSLVDFGIRAKTRLALCSAGEKDRAAWPHILTQSVATFAAVGALTIAATFALTALGILNNLFKISSTNRNLLFITTTMSMFVMLSGLLLEPLVAIGRIGKLKLAIAGGWLAAIPAVAFVLATKGSVTAALVSWLGCLLGANLFVLFKNRFVFLGAGRFRCQLELRKLVATLRESLWFNICNATWMARTYGVTLVISALNGPATAGLFFILLRLSEIISALGAISSDASLGQLAQAPTVDHRRQRFESSYSWAALFCAHIALVIGFFTSTFYQIWLHPATPLSPLTGMVVVALGLGSALNRTATYAAMGLNLVRKAAKWGLAEAVLFLSAIIWVPNAFGLVNRLAAASLSACALLPLTWAISRRLLGSPTKLWLSPLGWIAPFAGTSAVVLFFADLTAQPASKLLAVLICGGIGLLNIAEWQRRRARCEISTPLTMAPHVPCWTE
jgi:O-antigen/teichoic acid export membrane protein